MNLRTKFLCAAAISFIAAPFGNVAHAYTITVSDTLIADNGIFDGCVGMGGCSTLMGFFDVMDGSIQAGGTHVVHLYVPPAPTGAYITTNNTTLHTVAPLTSIEFNWGSVDSALFDGGENYFSAGNTLISGSTILALGDPLNLDRNYGVTISDLDPFTVATWTNNDVSFPGRMIEFNSVGVPGGIAPGAPEASTWMMMLLGFAAVGFAAKRQKDTRWAISS